MKKTLKWLLSLCLTISMLPMCAGCGSEYDMHGFDEYFHVEEDSTIQMGNSPVEIDQFCDIYPLYTEYSYINGDYHYSYEDFLPLLNVLELALIYFEYEESDYQAAKAYCEEKLTDMGDAPSEEYNGYQFYDIHEKRDKEYLSHKDDYPYAFQRAIFHEEKNVIAFIGVYVTVNHATAVEQDIQDWGSFLQKYFGEYYSFDN